MAGLWLAITLVVGKGWCSYACFFGGIEEGMAAIPKRAKLRKIDPRWRYGPWAVLLAMVLLSLALFEPAYCMWLCPFKAVSEYVAARNTVGMVQNGIFIAAVCGTGNRAAIADKEANAMLVLLPVWRVPIDLQQDQRLRCEDRPDALLALRALPERLPDYVADEGIHRAGRDADVVHEVRRVRGCVSETRRCVAYQGNGSRMEAGTRAAACFCTPPGRWRSCSAAASSLRAWRPYCTSSLRRGE